MGFVRCLWAPVLTVAVVIGLSDSADATVIVPRSVEEMSVDAAAVVRAKVLQRQSMWDADHRRIHTYTELQVLESVHAVRDVGRTVVVRTMGGEVGDIGMSVSGVAKFEPGEEVLLFLRPDPLDARNFQVMGMSQGKYTIDRSGPTPMAIPGVHGLAFARRDAKGAVRVAHDPSQPALTVSLTGLVARVKLALRKAPEAPNVPVVPPTPNAPPTPTAPVTPPTPVAPGEINR